MPTEKVTRRDRLDRLEARLCSEYAQLYDGLVRLGLPTDRAERVAWIYIERRIAAIPSHEEARRARGLEGR